MRAAEPALGGEKIGRIAKVLVRSQRILPGTSCQAPDSTSQVVVAEVRRAAPGCTGVAVLRMGSLRITIGDRFAAQMEARGSR